MARGANGNAIERPHVLRTDEGLWKSQQLFIIV